MHRIESTNYIVESGKNKFSNTPPATTLNAEWCNSVQEEIAHVVEQSGISLKTKSSDSQTQLWEALQASTQVYDLIVSNQATFNSIIERTGANQYRFKSGYTSVYFKYVVGGYAVAGAASFLSGGDTYGVLSPNEMLNMYFAPGAYLNCADTAFYLNCNKSGTIYTNVVIQGAASSAAAVTDGFVLGNTYNKFINCGVKNRLSNTTMNGFRGSGTALHNYTSSYIGCYCDNLISSGLVYGFYLCENLNGCIGNNLESTGNGCYSFYTCSTLSNCVANAIDAAGGASIGFYYCIGLSICKALNIANASGAHVTSGFHYCDQLSGCYASTIAGTGSGFGFGKCKYIVSCYATVISGGAVGDGFNDCTYGAALYSSEATNAGNDFIDTTDAAVTNKVSCPAIFT